MLVEAIAALLTIFEAHTHLLERHAKGIGRLLGIALATYLPRMVPSPHSSRQSAIVSHNGGQLPWGISPCLSLVSSGGLVQRMR